MQNFEELAIGPAAQRPSQCRRIPVTFHFSRHISPNPTLSRPQLDGRRWHLLPLLDLSWRAEDDIYYLHYPCLMIHSFIVRMVDIIKFTINSTNYITLVFSFVYAYFIHQCTLRKCIILYSDLQSNSNVALHCKANNTISIIFQENKKKSFSTLSLVV